MPQIFRNKIQNSQDYLEKIISNNKIKNFYIIKLENLVSYIEYSIILGMFTSIIYIGLPLQWAITLLVLFSIVFFYISSLDIKDKHYIMKLSFSLLSLAILPYTGIIDMCITQDFNIIFPYFYSIHALFLLFTTALSINGLV